MKYLAVIGFAQLIHNYPAIKATTEGKYNPEYINHHSTDDA